MADKDVATGAWQCARLTGIAAALALTMAVTPAEAKTQSPAHGAPGAAKGQKNGAANGQKMRTRGSTPSPKKSTPSPTKTRGRGDAGGSTQKQETPPRGETPPNSHAKAGKTTICHSTGSATNPYVEITISDNALHAHARHHDGRDIIPAPAEGCESGAAQGAGEQTGSEDVEGGVLGRRRTNRVSEAETVDKERKRNAAAGGVLGAAESNVGPEAVAQPAAEEADEGGSLPFTGLALGAVLLMAVAAVATGAALRRASRELE